MVGDMLMKKVSILALHLGYGGIEKSIVALANMIANDYDVEIISTYKLSEKSAFDINDKVKMIIDSLTVGTSEVKNGFLPIIPKGTKLIDFNIENDLIKINFSKELLNISLENENKLIESIVFSLTSLEGIEKVMIFG